MTGRRDYMGGSHLSTGLQDIEQTGTASRAIVRIIFHLAADKGDPARDLGDVLGQYTRTTANSPGQFVSSIKSMLASCANHEGCKRTFSGCKTLDTMNSPLPTRCIRIIRSGDDNAPTVTLEKTAGKRGKYITLSHRWNNQTETTRTTAANLAERLQGHGLLGLSVLFADSFALAAKLDIFNRWGFRIRGVRMADYYQNSVFTIACPNADEARGLFSQTAVDDARVPLIRLPYRDASGRQRGYFYLFRAQKPTDEYREIVTNGELLTCGWIFQEWLLSRRVVCFTPTGLFLACQTRSPQTQARDLVVLKKRSDQERFSNDFSLKNSIMGGEYLFLPWGGLGIRLTKHVHEARYTLVTAYSNLKLTNLQDRLAALSGIADELGDAIRSHFDPRFARAKSAKKNGNERVIHRTYAEYQAGALMDAQPQGALASGPLEVLPGDRSNRTSLRDNPRARFPMLCLRAKLQPVILGRYFASEEDRYIARHVTSREVRLDGNRRMVASPLARDQIAEWASIKHPDLAQLPDDPELGLNRVIIYALHISTLHGAGSGFALGYCSKKHSVYNYLFVRAVKTLANGYERVGMGGLVGKDFDRGFEMATMRGGAACLTRSGTETSKTKPRKGLCGPDLNRHLRRDIFLVMLDLREENEVMVEPLTVDC
ncbi:hypothetical protein B0H66DRAFT_627032 [Apodospora peruviana]|uniref:Uncharacterized protein n=1 Tax=Apodospora peruviana TaxID=516989 RepID=A0AAE0M0K3_9PEZI|nr:hypothetical protein B0H66DRAFT_627032 [Apodospora peruviana]